MNLLPIVRNARTEDDLITIWRHSARDSEAAADRLLPYPFSGAPRDEIRARHHHMVVGEYLTLYRVADDAIEILRVLHGHRNIEVDGLRS